MKKLSILLALLLVFSLLTVSAFAVHIATVTVTASSSSVYRGETVTVTVSTTSVEDCVTGGFMFDYDKNIFEYVSGTALISGYSSADISTINNNLAGYFMNGNETVEGDIFQITLKVKNDAAFGNYTITGTSSMNTSSAEVTCFVEGAVITVACNHNMQETAAEVPATCLDAGKTAVLTCSICGHTEGGEEIPALGHTDNDYTDNGDGTHTVACSVCGTVANAAEAHNFVDGTCACGAVEEVACEHTYDCGVCTKCGEFGYSELTGKMSSIGLSAESEVLLQFRVSLDNDLVNDDNAYAVYTLNGKTGRVSMKDIREGGKLGGYWVVYVGVASALMNHDVEVRFFDGEGKAVMMTDYADASYEGTVITRKATDWAKLALEKGNAATKKLAEALLIYGGYAQGYFKDYSDNPAYNILPDYGYEINDLSSITADTITQTLTVSSGSIGITYYNQSPGLESAVYLRTRFKLASGQSIDNFSFVATVPDGTSTKQVELTPEKDGNYYKVDIENIAAAYWDYMYTITVTNKTTGESIELTFSILAWIDRMLGGSKDETQILLGKAMYYYNQAANELFNK